MVEFFKKESWPNDSWLKEHKVDLTNIVSFAGDASTRKYYRLAGKDGKKFIAVTYEPTEVGKKSFERFIFWQKKYVELNIPVPEIYHTNEDALLMILEDLGSKSLLSEISQLQAREQNVLLEQSLGLLMPLQKLHLLEQSHSTQGIFNREKLDFELNLSIQHFSKTFDLPSIQSNKETIQEIWGEFLSDAFREKDFVWCHRDFHAKNIMIDSQKKLRLIDFQDTMRGPRFYDLCSLLHDSYLNYSETTKELILKNYKNSHGDFENLYYVTMAQRTFKAIGSFCYVFQYRQNYFYLRHVGLAMEHFNFALKKINTTMSKELIKLMVNPYYNL